MISIHKKMENMEIGIWIMFYPIACLFAQCLLGFGFLYCCG